MSENHLKLVRAQKCDIPSVCEIYESVKSGKYCPWNESYPTEENAVEDVEAQTLYLLKDGNNILGCISLEPSSADDDLCWKVCDGNHREIVRVAVAPSHQGKGYAKVMVNLLIDEMKRQHVSSLHLLVAKANPPALNTYKAVGFEIIGECYRYDTDFFIGELVL